MPFSLSKEAISFEKCHSFPLIPIPNPKGDAL
jgi:hypothetical protein